MSILVILSKKEKNMTESEELMNILLPKEVSPALSEKNTYYHMSKKEQLLSTDCSYDVYYKVVSIKDLSAVLKLTPKECYDLVTRRYRIAVLKPYRGWITPDGEKDYGKCSVRVTSYKDAENKWHQKVEEQTRLKREKRKSKKGKTMTVDEGSSKEDDEVSLSEDEDSKK